MTLEAAVDGAAGQLRVDARRITSTISSSGNCSDVRSSQTASSMADRLVVSLFGRASGRHAGSAAPATDLVSPTASSAANSATGFLLRWM